MSVLTVGLSTVVSELVSLVACLTSCLSAWSVDVWPLTDFLRWDNSSVTAEAELQKWLLEQHRRHLSAAETPTTGHLTWNLHRNKPGTYPVSNQEATSQLIWYVPRYLTWNLLYNQPGTYLLTTCSLLYNQPGMFPVSNLETTSQLTQNIPFI